MKTVNHLCQRKSVIHELTLSLVLLSSHLCSAFLIGTNDISSLSVHSCFLSLLLVAAVVWKIKQSCWASRRREVSQYLVLGTNVDIWLLQRHELSWRGEASVHALDVSGQCGYRDWISTTSSKTLICLCTLEQNWAAYSEAVGLDVWCTWGLENFRDFMVLMENVFKKCVV